MQGPTHRTRMGDEVLIEVFDPEEGQWVCVDVQSDPICGHCGDDDHRSHECPNYDPGYVPEEAELSNEDSPQYGDC